MKRLILSAVIAGLQFPAIAMTNEEASLAAPAFLTDSVIDIHEVVVTATNLKVNKNLLPYSVSIVKNVQIQESGESAVLSVLSGRVPSLFVTERGVTGYGISDGGSGGIKIRGVGGSPTTQVLMMVDGQPQFAGLFGHPVPDTYLSHDIERVEVVRGPASTLYGSNAMGGVINVITRQQKTDGVHTQAQALYGSCNTSKWYINNGTKFGKFNSFVSLNYDRTDGQRSNSQFKLGSAYAKLGYQFTESWKANLDYNLTKYKANDPGPVNTPYDDPASPHDQNILRGAATFNLDNQYGQRTNGSLKVFYSYGIHKIFDGFRSSDDHLGILGYQSFCLTEGNCFTVGVDYKRYGAKARNILADKEILPRRNVNEIAGYLTAQQSFWDHFLTLNAGLRYEHNSTYGNEWVPQGGFALRPVETSILKASVAKGYRNPTLRDLYITWGPRNQANPDLRPERMINYEVSFTQYLLENKLMVELTGYIAKGSEMITLVDNKLANTGKFTNKGIEVSSAYDITSKLNLTASYSYLHTDVLLGGAPKNQFFVGANWRPLKQLRLDLQLRHIGSLNVISGKEVKKQDYTLLNSKIAYLPVKGIELFALLDNILDQSYEINAGYPMPGFNLFGGIKVMF